MMKRITLALSLAVGLLCASQAQVMMLFSQDSLTGIVSPLDVDSLFYWFAADVGVTDSLGGAIATDEGVGSWLDLSGRGHHVTQSTNGARPVYKATGGPGSNPCIQFDGSNDYLAEATASWWGSDDLTVFIVYKNRVNTGTSTYFVLSRWDGSLSQRQWTLREIYLATGPVRRSDFNVTPDGTTTNTISPDDVRRTNFHVSSITYDDPGSSYSWYIDGTDGTPTVPSGGGSPPTEIQNVTQKLGIGTVNTDSTPTAFFDGSISEIIVYSRALSVTERSAIENYLNRKYDLY